MIAIGVLLTGVMLMAARHADCAEAPVVFPKSQEAYVVAQPATPLESRFVDALADYVKRVTGAAVRRVDSLDAVPEVNPVVVLSNGRVQTPIPLSLPSDHPEAFAVVTGNVQKHRVVVACGRTGKGLKRAIQRLVVKSRQTAEGLAWPQALSETPWIPSREWTVCPWEPQLVRGLVHNPYADPRLRIQGYDDERLARYVDMFDWFGYSGCQLTETCYNYAAFGTREAAQQWQRKLATDVHRNGQDVSLWAWAAEFSQYGWKDPDVIYTPKAGMTAFEDPNVRRGFEKYYDFYAQLAPQVDRFIAHFYDPGQLTNRDDVINYMRLLEQKLKAANPSIKMSIDAWAAEPKYLLELVDHGFGDYLFLEPGYADAFVGDAREQLHTRAKQLGLRLGMWGWYDTEYETDQLAGMYVNAKVLKSHYTELRKGALSVYPVEYWSEMEAHHLNNIYSMYVASRLLWDLDQDPQAVLQELTDAVWGPKNGVMVLRALGLIEDMRSGPTWSTYWWPRPEHRVGTADPQDDFRRADQALTELKAMKPDDSFVPKIPLPFPPETFVELMIPHLMQIRQFAQFRLDVEAIRKAAGDGASKETLEKMAAEAWKPVPEYNTWIGTFGTKEIREQKRIMADLAKKSSLTIQPPPWFRAWEAHRGLELLRTMQSRFEAPVAVSPDSFQEFYWSDADRADRFRKLVEEGSVVQIDGVYHLADWSDWASRD